MEHRWGERFAVRMSVELSSGSSSPVAGCLEDVSASGAFVRTAGRGPPRGPVTVFLRQDGALRLAAYVVRETESGVGIEWCRFAPRAVRELMTAGQGAGADRARARAARSTRRSSRELNMEMPPRAQTAPAPPAIRTRT
ncbi:MAG: PilZ domain-containing protein [Steroidobacteraceae bacterium]